MNQSLRRITLVASLILVATAHPTNALFGSECKKPKASYENYQSKARMYSAQAAKNKIANADKLKRDTAACNADFKSFAFARNKSIVIKKKADCIMLPLFDEYLYAQGTVESKNATKDSYQVVLNNQKCFSPELVIEAQRKLGIIK